MLVSVGQARRTLETLIEDRKLLSRQLAELKHQEQDENDEPAAKVWWLLSWSLRLLICVSVKQGFTPSQQTISPAIGLVVLPSFHFLSPLPMMDVIVALRQSRERPVSCCCFFFLPPYKSLVQELGLSSKRQPLRVHPLSSGVGCFYYYLNYQLANRLWTAEDSPEEEAPSSSKILELNSNTFDSLNLTDTSLPSKRFRLGYCAKVAARALQ